MNEDRLLMWAKIAATTTATSVALFLFASAVVGQSNKLTLEQAHIIKEIKDKRLPVVELSRNFEVGDSLPETVQPVPMPDELANRLPQLRAYRLVLTSKEILLVAPRSLEVSETIDR